MPEKVGGKGRGYSFKYCAREGLTEHATLECRPEGVEEESGGVLGRVLF